MPTIKGCVTAIRHQNEDFCIFIMAVDSAEPAIQSREVCISGHLYGLAQVRIGVTLCVVGEWVEHPKFGRQIKPFGWLPYARTSGDVATFLGHCIHGFEDADFTRLLVTRYGTDIYNKLRQEPDEIRSIFGPDDPMRLAADRAISGWEQAASMSALAAFLKDNDLGISQVRAIFETLGIDAVNVIAENPYRLVAVEGFSFTKADKLAKRLGIGPNDGRRLEGAILAILWQESRQGHLCVRRGDLQTLLDDMLAVEAVEAFAVKDLPSAIMAAVDRMVELKTVMLDPSAGVYLPDLYRYERDSASKLARFVTPSKLEVDISAFLLEYEKTHAIALSEAQREAVRLLIENRVLVLTGGPGTGKTTLVRTFVRLFKQTGITCQLMAPTGIAAKRLAAVTGNDAATIHRTFGYNGRRWLSNNFNKFNVGAVIVDEMCLPYKQFVDLADGTRRYIGTIVNQKQSVQVLSRNADGVVEPKKVVGWFKYNRSKPLYELHLSLAKNRERQRFLRCTGQHKIYVPGGQKRAEDLKVGDQVIVRGVFLNTFQRSFLLGSLLGDAGIGGRVSGRILQFSHGQPQEKYIRFKAALFRCHAPYLVPGGYRPDKQVWQCYSPIIDDLDDLHTQVYPKGRKRVTRAWLDQIDQIGLAAWYMDDGQLCTPKTSSPYAVLHSEGFTRLENEILVEWLCRQWGLTASVYSNRRGHFYLRLTCAASRKFWKLIQPYMFLSMGYKLPTGFKAGLHAPSVFRPFVEVASYPVRHIRTYTPKDNTRNFVYDIEVEDNHNYFSNNVLVSNSMVDQELFYRVLDALHPSTMLVLVGDDAQLSSVGPGSVLRELLGCSVIPHIRLTQIFRQAEKSDIVKASHLINRGEALGLTGRPPESDFQFVNCPDEKLLADLIVKMAEKLKARDANFQVLSPKYDGVTGVTNLNDRLRESLNPDKGQPEWVAGKIRMRIGDRVMVTKNDYELNVYNGDMGKLHAIHRTDLVVKVHAASADADLYVTISKTKALEMLRLAYAITVHKSQGSEFDTIIMPIVKAHGRMRQRNLFYTAITRARKKVWLLGDPLSVHQAISNDKVVFRNTVFGRVVRTAVESLATPAGVEPAHVERQTESVGESLNSTTGAPQEAVG